MIPMRLNKREITDRKELISVIEECQVVRIGSQDEEGMFIVPMNYGYGYEEKEGEISLRLYVHSAKEGRKARAFQKTPQIAFEMDCGHELIEGSYTCSYSYAYRSIMGTGVICRLTDREEKKAGLKALLQHTAPESQIIFKDEMIDAVDVYRIDVKEWKGKKREKK